MSGRTCACRTYFDSRALGAHTSPQTGEGGKRRSAAGGRVSELISRTGPGWQARAAPVNRFGPTVSKSGTIGGLGQGPGIVAPQRWDISPLRRRAPFCADKKGRKSRLEPAVLRTPFALTCTGCPVLLAEQALLSAGGRCNCPRVRASSALAWWVDELPTIPHRTTKHQAKSGAMTTGPGDHHNRRPTGGVRLYSKLIRCNDYPSPAAPADAPREANTQKGVLRESGDAPPAAGGASRFRGSGTIGGPDQGPGIVMPQR